MKQNQIVKPSSQVDTLLPLWIRNPSAAAVELTRSNYFSENHRNFVNFMTKADESEERFGFGQDILQNLLKYRDFDTYEKQIIQYNYLAINGTPTTSDVENQALLTDDPKNILSVNAIGDAYYIEMGFELSNNSFLSEDDDVIELVDGYGFPEENGVVLIDDEVILYRRREGNFLYELERGSAGTSLLPTFRRRGTYLRSEPQKHYSGAVVINLSVLFLVSMLDTIHKTYAHQIDSQRVVPEINRSTLLQNIKDFFRAKGSKLGIKALFKFMFAENDVDVFYPGDRMIQPSESTWAQPLIVRTVPIPEVFCDPQENYTLPTKVIGSEVLFKSYTATIVNEEGKIVTHKEDDVFARTYCEYSTSYQFEGQTQYELTLDESSLEGDIICNPTTTLTRRLEASDAGAGIDDTRLDTATITVESTLAFPDKGLLFIDGEGIYYNDKTPNQFLKCKRAYLGVRRPHSKGSIVYGPYYIENRFKDEEGVEHVSRSWPLGLVDSVEVVDAGILHTMNDKVELNGPGRVDPRDPLLCQIDGNGEYKFTFRENYTDKLLRQSRQLSPLHSNRTYGVDGVYYDDRNVFVSSSGFPEYVVGAGGQFDGINESLSSDQVLSIIPRRKYQQENTYDYKGNETIGVFVDGVRAYSNVSPETVVQGRISSFNILKPGTGYKNPTVVLSPALSSSKAVVDPRSGAIVGVEMGESATFIDHPKCRISSGEGAVFSLMFDNYGRIGNVSIKNPGEYYNDVPKLRIIDQTGRGKGALVSCEVSDGKIISVKIVNRGIDYNPTSTIIEATPIGSGADVEAVVEHFHINRYTEVINKEGWNFDQGGGFLYESLPGVARTTYGYVANPGLIRQYMLDKGIEHSPIIGYAFDGNPIYGPYGYVNGVDDSEGITRQLSAYVLMGSRNETVPSGGGVRTAFDPPKTDEYPMGSFVEDYIYLPNVVNPDEPDYNGFLASELPNFLHTEDERYIELDTDQVKPIYEPPKYILDKNNGRVCNTPDYPKELYPDGVYCYFITVASDDVTPVFPYIIGETFHNRPISQLANVISRESIAPLPRTNIYSPRLNDDTDLTFDFRLTERLRNPYLNSTRKGVELGIANLSSGSVDGVVIQEPGPDTCRVGDFVFFDHTDTGGGGAQAIVGYVDGAKVSRTDGGLISTTIESHRQLLHFDNNIDSFGNPYSYTFVEGTQFYTYGSSGISRGVVGTYDQELMELEVFVTTDNLIQPGDRMYDNKNTNLIVGEVDVLPETRTQDKLYFKDTKYFNPGDILEIQNGSPDGVYITHELAKVESIRADGFVYVTRGYQDEQRSKPIPDGTRVAKVDAQVYIVSTKDLHHLYPGDKVVITGSKYDEINGEHSIDFVEPREFMFYVNGNFINDDPISYATNSEIPTGSPQGIELTSGGIGYEHLPKILGIDKRLIDRAETKIVMAGQSIGSVEVLDGGFRYKKPKAVFLDYQYGGEGATADVVVEDGRVVSVNVTNGGSGYIEPLIYLIEDEGKYIPLTSDIGKITSVKVINPGREISADRSLKPEVQIDTRCIVEYITSDINNFLIIDGGTSTSMNSERLDGNQESTAPDKILSIENLELSALTPILPFQVGEYVYQGLYDNKQVTAYVKEYDEERQIVTLHEVEGNLMDGEVLYNTLGTKGYVYREGQSDCRVVVDGTSKPEGYFIDDTSKVSESYPVIQDSYRYQWFSYVISSPLQAVEYNTFVNDIVHPAGFARFADVTLHSHVDSLYISDDSDGVFEIMPTNRYDYALIESKDDTPILTGQNNYVTIPSYIPEE